MVPGGVEIADGDHRAAALGRSPNGVKISLPGGAIPTERRDGLGVDEVDAAPADVERGADRQRTIAIGVHRRRWTQRRQHRRPLRSPRNGRSPPTSATPERQRERLIGVPWRPALDIAAGERRGADLHLGAARVATVDFSQSQDRCGRETPWARRSVRPEAPERRLPSRRFLPADPVRQPRAATTYGSAALPAQSRACVDGRPRLAVLACSQELLPLTPHRVPAARPPSHRRRGPAVARSARPRLAGVDERLQAPPVGRQGSSPGDGCR